MDRIALAKRLEGLSKVFASDSPYHRDLKAMSEVLQKVDDDKFKTILSTDFVSDVAAGDKEAVQPMLQQPLPTTRERMEEMRGRSDRKSVV